MSLTRKVSHKKRPTNAHRKRSGMHHKKSDNYTKAYWPYLPMLAIITFGLVFSSGWSNTKKDVLGYATEMSASNLLSGTNAQRAASGLGALALNATLNQAAQNKAQDMANKDYWSHTSPDGSTPWTFLNNAGYSYQSAGENLAYGFSTSSGVITGWMNSPGHRANLLGTDFTEVGFGVVNAPNYQGSGPQTIVVAMYGQPYSAPAPAPTPAPQPAPASPAPQVTATGSTAATAAGGANTPASEATPESAPTAQAEEPKPSVVANTKATPKQLANLPSKDTSRVETIASANNAAWTHFAVSLLASVALLVLLLRHSFAWHKLIVKGEQFVLKHPALDIVFVVVLAAIFVLTRTAGFIR